MGLCNAAAEADPKQVATKVGNFIKSRVDYINPEKVELILYIAAPPKEQQKISIMAEHINKNYQVKVLTGGTLTSWLEKRHQNCPKEVFDDQMHDFVSLFEMEICSRSKIFIYSGGSSWSRNINMERQAKRADKKDIDNQNFLVASGGGKGNGKGGHTFSSVLDEIRKSEGLAMRESRRQS